MHTTTPIKAKRDLTIRLGPAFVPGNLFRITDQVAMAKQADKRQERRKMKEKRKSRKWRPE